jgi:hypothetical protein
MSRPRLRRMGPLTCLGQQRPGLCALGRQCRESLHALLDALCRARDVRLLGEDLRHALECVQHGAVMAAQLPADPSYRHRCVAMGVPCRELAGPARRFGERPTLPRVASHSCRATPSSSSVSARISRTVSLIVLVPELSVGPRRDGTRRVVRAAVHSVRHGGAWRTPRASSTSPRRRLRPPQGPAIQ